MAGADEGNRAPARKAAAEIDKLLTPTSLPVETRFPSYPLRQYGDFWLPQWVLPGVAAAHTRFEPRPDDVFLASFPKSGTTWLKALAFATLNRAEHPPSDREHPLRRRNPHDCVKFMETPMALSTDVFGAFPSPRLLATHLAYSLLPTRITTEGSGCRIVYICRDPKDALVSFWFFTKKAMAATKEANAGNPEQPPPPPQFTIDEAFELFCDGRLPGGPQWQHVVEYWDESRRRPEKVLFLRYEEMLRDPVSNVKKLAEFMGCAFSGEEEAAGVLHDIVELCSLDTLKSSEGNKKGTQRLNHKNESFFRKGVAGDWRNHMTPAMAARIDRVVDDAIQGSGFTFAVGDPGRGPHAGVADDE